MSEENSCSPGVQDWTGPWFRSINPCVYSLFEGNTVIASSKLPSTSYHSFHIEEKKKVFKERGRDRKERKEKRRGEENMS